MATTAGAGGGSRTAAWRTAAWRLAAAALAVVLAGCGSTAETATGGKAAVRVVAAENVWGDIVRQVGGEHVQVMSVLNDPAADPHSFETDPKTAAAVGSASFVVLNGAGYDDFAGKLLAASPNDKRVVLTVAEAVGVGPGANPHLWYSPDYLRQGAQAIADRLTTADPGDGPAFRANLQSFLTSYQPYVDTLAAIKAKYGGSAVAYTERVPGYLVDAAGLTLGSPAAFAQAVEDGTDPSPGDTAAFNRAVQDRTVKVLLYNAQVTSPTTDGIQARARAAGIPVVGVTETIPGGVVDFQTWQTGQAKAILTALGG